MFKVLCTFSGKYGDILWSMPTVKAIAKKEGVKVAFACMPSYTSLIPLLKVQDYISEAFVIDEWLYTGSPFGDQPWSAPAQRWSEKIYHLTYRTTPDIFLAAYIAREAGVVLDEPYEPFIKPVLEPLPYTSQLSTVAYSFNPMYAVQKKDFIDYLKETFPSTSFIDTTELSWNLTAYVIKQAKCFIGCRSSNHVLAHGLGQKLIIFEPHPDRAGGMPIFTCPWGTERQVNSAEEAKSILLEWL